MHFGQSKVSIVGAFIVMSVVTGAPALQVIAQSPQLQQKVEEIKQASAANKLDLARYDWQEQQTISLKGEVKKTVIYQVSIGPGGTQQKVVLSSLPAAAPPSGGRMKQHVIEKKTDEFQQYGQDIGALVKQYTQPDPQLLQQAFQQGNISLQAGGSGGAVSLVIKNYIKPGDSMTMVFNEAAKAIEGIQVASYLSDPKDAVTLAVQFAKLPSGTNHVAATNVDGVSKQMTVAILNSNYQHTQM